MSDRNPEAPVESGAVDAHCHLFLLDGEPSDAVEAARAAGVSTLVCAGIDPESSYRAVALAESLPAVFATAGMHPHDASRFDAKAEAEIEGLLANPQVVGVGECGLDLFRLRSPREDQERVFRRHIALSRSADLPLVVHVREAWPEILRLLAEGRAERVVLHCFSGDADVARECADRGYFLSFAGNVTYPKSRQIRAAVSAAPLDHILVETDSPFLAPQCLRGRDNEPANVVSVIEEIARVRGESFDRVREATAANARVAFPRLA